MTNETKMKHCNTCDTTQAVEAFSKHKGTRDGLQYKCKSCTKVHYQANREQILEQKKTYQQENAEAITEYQKGYSKARRSSMTTAELAAKASVNLARCRSELSSDELYGGLTWLEACTMTLPFAEERLRLEQETGIVHHLDHVVPIKAGGTHTVCNIQVLSAADNCTKAAEDKLMVAEYKELELS